MRIVFLAICSVLLLFAQEESFLSQVEYGKMLYENPRGIGCIQCHGERGEGVVIGHYVHNKKEKTIQGVGISHLTLEEFIKALKTPKRVMPKYYLTQEEIEAIYFYLQSMQP